MGAISFTWCRNEASVLALRQEWEALGLRARAHLSTVLFSYQWAAWRHVARPRGWQLRVLSGRSEGRLVLVLPMMQRRRRLRFLGSEKFEYRDVLVEDGPQADAWIGEAVGHLARCPGVAVLDLQDVAADGALGVALSRLALSGAQGRSESPVIRLDGFAGWDDYARSLPKSLMADQKRQWRRVEAGAEPMRFRLVEAGEADRLLDWMLARKLRWAAARGIDPGIMATQDYRRLLKALVGDAMARKAALFGRLGSAGRIASAGFGYIEHDRFVFFMFAYDEDLATFSPSRLLQEELIRCCFACGVALFDFLPGEEAYKRVWARDAVPVLNLLVPLTAPARARIVWSRKAVPWLARQTLLRIGYDWLPRRVRQGLRWALRGDWDWIRRTTARQPGAHANPH